jgi:hypothetical protein
MWKKVSIGLISALTLTIVICVVPLKTVSYQVPETYYEQEAYTKPFRTEICSGVILIPQTQFFWGYGTNFQYGDQLEGKVIAIDCSYPPEFWIVDDIGRVALESGVSPAKTYVHEYPVTVNNFSTELDGPIDPLCIVVKGEPYCQVYRELYWVGERTYYRQVEKQRMVTHYKKVSLLEYLTCNQS